jgi:hypothetical protein
MTALEREREKKQTDLLIVSFSCFFPLLLLLFLWIFAENKQE